VVDKLSSIHDCYCWQSFPCFGCLKVHIHLYVNNSHNPTIYNWVQKTPCTT
jgi:hypothetical protein